MEKEYFINIYQDGILTDEQNKIYGKIHIDSKVNFFLEVLDGNYFEHLVDTKSRYWFFLEFDLNNKNYCFEIELDPSYNLDDFSIVENEEFLEMKNLFTSVILKEKLDKELNEKNKIETNKI